MEAPVRSLAKFAKELKLTKSDTENFPFISTDIANKLIDLMQESGEIKILHNPSSMVLDGNQVNIKSGIEYHFTSANESTRNSSPANSSKSEQLQGSAKKSPRYIGLSLELTPRIKKYQIIEIDLSFQFTRLIEDKRSDKNEREPIFWSSNTDTSIQMNPGQSFISVGASSEKGLELISFLTAQIKK
jgi:type II secretory pathway component GspD/PulD (secretin)